MEYSKKNPLVFILISLLSIWLGGSILFYFYPIRDVNPIVILMVIAAVWITMFYMVRSFRDFSGLSKWKKGMTGLFLTLFSFILLFSIRGEQLYLEDNSLISKVGVYAGTYLTILLSTAAIILLLLSVRGIEGQRKTSKMMIIIYGLPALLSWLFFWIALFPGGMTPDSLAQWGQAETLELSNWHPVIYTLMIAGLTELWDSPGVVTLAQILILSSIVGYAGYKMEQYSFPKWAVLLFAVIAAISPLNSIYSIMIWKDVLYSSFLLLFTILIFNLVKTNGHWIKGKKQFLFIIAAAICASFFRHNGFPVVMISLFTALILYRHAYKQIGSALVLIGVIYLVITNPIYNYYNVKPSDPNEALSIPTQMIGTVIAGEGNLTEEQLDYYNRLLPLDRWKNQFNPYISDPIKFSGGYERSVIFDDWGLFFSNWKDVVLQNPVMAAGGFLKHTSLVWQINEPPAPGYTAAYVTNVYDGNRFGLENKIISTRGQYYAKSYLNKTREYLGHIIWRPAVYLYLIILFTFVAYLRNNYSVLLIALPVLLNTAAVMATMPAQDFRYLFSCSLIMYLALFSSFMKFNKEPKYE
ncbi:DUF6020 family protein [Jeotgalibacillus sp. ET6]|uniref:DUF6020 family protein n=1 Tax=Jeotgalibacillus sp. ET6 TaxID=3037260 RepID=UPI002418289D|nr:DUF6020 family protein [Jeotgalibacillus sp. ET6]MDG5471548.1 DUF6020 family protein [Jeotgalibacillus sp. ET6]